MPHNVMQIIGEINQSAEKDRRQNFRKRGRIYRDGGKDFLIEYITNEFGAAAVNEMRLAPINALKSWVDKKSVIYARPAIRVAAEESDQALMDFYVDMLGFDSVMQKANRYFNLYSNAELYVIPQTNRDGTKKPSIHVVPPFLYSVSTDEFDQTKKKVLVFSSFVDQDDGLPSKEVQPTGDITTEKHFKSEGDVVNSSESPTSDRNIYIFWTDEEHFTTDERGNLLLDEMNPEMINPIGVIPSVTLRKEVDNEFWAMQGQDMIDMAMAVQLGFTDLLSIAKMQGFSILTVTSSERPTRIELGINKTVWIKQSPDEPTPSIDYVQASSPLDQYTALLNRVLEVSSASNLLPPNTFAGEANASSTSGIHEMLKNAATLMEIESQKPVLRDAELDTWMLIKDWHNLLHDNNELPQDLRALGKFSDGFAPQVSYQDMKPIESEEERISQVERLLDKGLISRMDAFKKLFPEMSDKQIEEKMQEIEDEKKERAEMFGIGAPTQEQGDLTQNEGDEEDPEDDEDDTDQV